MKFEEQLKQRIEKNVIKDLEQLEILFNAGSAISESTKNVFQNFIDIIDAYNFKKYKNQKTNDEIFEIGENFEKLLTDEKLAEMYKKVQFTEEEKTYIKYIELSKKWREYSGFFVNRKYAVIDILIRKLIIEQYGEESIEEFKKIIEEENTDRMKRTCEHYSQLFSEKPYGESLQEKFEEELSNEVNILFNHRINCGGYSLKIDTEVYPYYYKDFSKCVSAILDEFPFVRLLGEEKLHDDEYLVLYRANKENTGHHFIRVDDDGVVREKDGIEEPQIFEGWGSLEDCEEAIFAVKKEHQMFNYELLEVNKRDKNVFNFERAVMNAINNRNNNFEYHNHEYSLKKFSDEEIVVVSDKNIVANIVTDGKEYLIEMIDEKKDYIENFSGKIKPIIENGCLINRSEFLEQREYKEDEGR